MSEQDKTVVITGASSGIGAEMAQYFAHRGWNVGFSYVGEQDAADQVVESIHSAGQKCVAQAADMGFKSEVDDFFDTVQTQMGHVSLLVNNAGVQTWAGFLELTEEDWDRTIRTNLKGYFLCTQKYARQCVENQKSGTVVMIGSGCNNQPFPRLVDYSASKGGVENLTKVAAMELGPMGIRVNCVAPGAIEIERTRLEAPEYAETWGNLAPLGRVGNATDIARAVEYLGSPGSDYITGQTLYVDGGVFTAPNWPQDSY